MQGVIGAVAPPGIRSSSLFISEYVIQVWVDKIQRNRYNNKRTSKGTGICRNPWGIAPGWFFFTFTAQRKPVSVALHISIDISEHVCYADVVDSRGGSRLLSVSHFPCGRPAIYFFANILPTIECCELFVMLL